MAKSIRRWSTIPGGNGPSVDHHTKNLRFVLSFPLRGPFDTWSPRRGRREKRPPPGMCQNPPFNRPFKPRSEQPPREGRISLRHRDWAAAGALAIFVQRKREGILLAAAKTLHWLAVRSEVNTPYRRPTAIGSYRPAARPALKRIVEGTSCYNWQSQPVGRPALVGRTT